MTKSYVSWWGLRLRSPDGYQQQPLTKRESLCLFASVGIVAELFWLLVASFLALPSMLLPPAFVSIEVLVPLALMSIPLTAWSLIPSSVLERTRPGVLVVLAREKGDDLGRWDWWLAGLGTVGLTLIMVRSAPWLWVTEGCLLSLFLSCMTSLRLFQPRVDHSQRRWKLGVPDWLRQPLAGDDGRTGDGADDVVVDPADGIVKAEEDANCRFEFGRGNTVGVLVPEAMVAMLREINAEKDGYLYQSEPEAVVLMDRPPVVDPAPRGRVISLCRQIISVAAAKRMTRFQLATEVLAFVQTQFRYEFDEDSTHDVPGGPYEEYGRFPVETLYDKVGDCECTSLLCASLLAHLGFEAALVHVKLEDPATGETEFHCAVGLEATGLMVGSDDDGTTLGGVDFVRHEDNPGKSWFYGETATERRIGFGVIPPDWKESMEVRSIDAIPSVRG